MRIVQLTFFLIFFISLVQGQTKLDSLYVKIDGYYSFDETLNEEINNVLNLRHGQGPFYSSGYQNQAFYLNADSIYLEIPHDYARLDHKRTLSLWFSVDSIPNEHCQIIDKSHGSDYSINITQDTALNVHFRYNKDLIRKVKVPIQLKKWNHLAVAVNQDVLSCYLNGRRFDKSPVPEPVISHYEAILGSGGTPYTAGYQFYGKIDELTFFNDALSANEIELLFKNGIKIEQTFLEISDFNKIPPRYHQFKKEAPDLNHHLNEIFSDTTMLYKANISQQDFWQIVNYKLAQSRFSPPKSLVRRSIPTAVAIKASYHPFNKWLWIAAITALFLVFCVGFIWFRRKNHLVAQTRHGSHENTGDQRVIVQLSTVLKEKSKILKELGEELKVLKKENNQHEINDLIRNMESKIKMSAMLSREIREIDASADRIRMEGLERLKNNFPKLTKNDLKLIELLIAGMSSKEISIALHISPQSVDTGRYRLRKKLKLKKSESLVYFLKNS